MALKNLILTIVGFILLGVGLVGVAVPVMPTTPFILVSAVCFTTGNRRIAKKLEQSRLFGSYIENYRTKTGIALKTKIISLVVLWTGLIISMIITQSTTYSVLIRVILLIVGICVSVHILLIKTKKITGESNA